MDHSIDNQTVAVTNKKPGIYKDVQHEITFPKMLNIVQLCAYGVCMYVIFKACIYIKHASATNKIPD